MYKHLVAHSEERENDSPSSKHTATGIATQAVENTLYKMMEVIRVLKSASSMFERAAHQVAGTNDLTLMHCLVLVHLSNSASCKQIDLKSATGITSAHLSRLVDDLTNRGMIYRNRSAHDRRQIILALTTSGRETALCLRDSLNDLVKKTPLKAFHSLHSSLEQVVSTITKDGWLS